MVSHPRPLDRLPRAKLVNGNSETTESASAPLSGLRIVAWEQAVAGPLASRHLLDLGAEVVKVERPGGGDMARHYDGSINGLSSHFVWLNRGKRSIVLDLKTDDGRLALERLIETADVFLHNQGPGAAYRLGFGNDQVRARHPRLIACAIAGFGEGPFRDRKAYDLIVQGETGIMALTGSPDMPMKVGIPVADIAAGMYAFSSILAALYQRQVTGDGSSIEISMFDALLEWASAALLGARYTGESPERTGQRHATIVPYGAYHVRDGMINLAVQTNAQWHRLCKNVLKMPALAKDERFKRNELRLKNRDALDAIIEAKWVSLSRTEVERQLAEADIPFGSIREIRDVLNLPQVADPRRWISLSTPNGPVYVLDHPMAISGLHRPTTGELSIPAIGEHTRQVLDELGLTSEHDGSHSEVAGLPLE